MKDWLAHREWKSSHLVSHHSNKKSIALTVEFSIKGERFLWSGSYNTTEKQNRCTQDAISRVFSGSADRQLLLKVEEGKVTIPKSLRSQNTGSFCLMRLKTESTQASWARL
jgi:hypothetical protein